VKLVSADPVTLVYHELRAPLGLLVTAARDAAEQSRDDDTRARCQTVVRTAERVLSTASQVLALAQAYRLEPSERICSPDAMITQFVHDVAGLGLQASLTRLCQCEDHVVHGNGDALQLVIQSLMTNAGDHSAEGGHIEVTIGCEGRDCQVSIANAADALRRHKGLGLGLYVCQQVAESQGWTLQVTPGLTRFEVSLRLPQAIGVAVAS
jgi:signal transduction histidine kinase